MRAITGAIFLAATVASSAAADPIRVTFYTHEASFRAASTTAVIDFEGIVPDTVYGTPEFGPGSEVGSTLIGNVVFSAPPNGAVIVAGSSAPVAGAPFNSALLLSVYASPLTATLPNGSTAVGGQFGNIVQTSSATLTLLGRSGILDVRNVTAFDMGFTTPRRFYGWTVDGDTIVGVRFDTHVPFEGIDDFRFGEASPVPEPGSLLLLASGLLGVWARFSRRSQ